MIPLLKCGEDVIIECLYSSHPFVDRRGLRDFGDALKALEFWQEALDLRFLALQVFLCPLSIFYDLSRRSRLKVLEVLLDDKGNEATLHQAFQHLIDLGAGDLCLGDDVTCGAWA